MFRKASSIQFLMLQMGKAIRAAPCCTRILGFSGRFLPSMGGLVELGATSGEGEHGHGHPNIQRENVSG